MRSLFFERTKNSGVAITQPAGWGGKGNEFKENQDFQLNAGFRLSEYGSLLQNEAAFRKCYMVPFFSTDLFLNSPHSPPQPAGLRNCNAAALAAFKKISCAFFWIPINRNRTQRGSLCSYCFRKCSHSLSEYGRSSKWTSVPKLSVVLLLSKNIQQKRMHIAWWPIHVLNSHQ